ncbi:MAG: nickel pincer cofactor biosynthesis protein LarB [Deltaproteobacteria bacterium]|nr:nickel pincer cofactor biosynthesis protein LarB [Deltaproteobacteria bacterium]
MEELAVKKLLNEVREGKMPVDDALRALKALPYEDIGFACIDHHRGLRKGLSEVIYGEGKKAEEIVAIMEKMKAQGENILVTRVNPAKAGTIQEKFPESEYHATARTITLEHRRKSPGGKGTILVITAGTSDIPVAEEAAVTARFMGNIVDTIYDVGVSGVHRVLGHREKLEDASVIIVVAGMEGALPSVVGGLVDCPVIAVPTSVGYGASFQGITALLGMLNSCAAERKHSDSRF